MLPGSQPTPPRRRDGRDLRDLLGDYSEQTGSFF
jgi:hypothetical protein